jgi:trimeric autotransporter adhesin
MKHQLMSSALALIIGGGLVCSPAMASTDVLIDSTGHIVMNAAALNGDGSINSLYCPSCSWSSAPTQTYATLNAAEGGAGFHLNTSDHAFVETASGHILTEAEAAALGINANTSAASLNIILANNALHRVNPSSPVDSLALANLKTLSFERNLVVSSNNTAVSSAITFKGQNIAATNVTSADYTNTGTVNTGTVNANKIVAGGVDVGGKLTTLTGTVDGHTVSINTLTGQVTQNGVDIGDLKTLTASHTVQIQDAAGKLTTLTGTVDGHTANLSDLNSKTSGLSSDGKSFTSSDSVTGVTTKVDSTGFHLTDANGGRVDITDPTIIVTDDSVNGTTKIHNGDVSVGNTLHVAGATVLDGGLTVAGNTTVNGDHTVTGNSRVKGNNVVDGHQTVGGNQFVAGDSVVGGSFYAGTFGGNTYSPNGEVGAALTNYGTALNNIYDQQGIFRNQIVSLQHDMKKAFTGSAVAMATGKFSLEAGKMVGASFDYANYAGYGAVGGTVAFRFTNELQGNISAGFGTENNEFGVRAGVIWQR